MFKNTFANFLQCNLALRVLSPRLRKYSSTIASRLLFVESEVDEDVFGVVGGVLAGVDDGFYVLLCLMQMEWVRQERILYCWTGWAVSVN